MLILPVTVLDASHFTVPVDGATLSALVRATVSFGPHRRRLHRLRQPFPIRCRCRLRQTLAALAAASWRDGFDDGDRYYR
jgi:hypothetical protein